MFATEYFYNSKWLFDVLEMSAEKDYLDATGNYPFYLIFQLVESALL